MATKATKTEVKTVTVRESTDEKISKNDCDEIVSISKKELTILMAQSARIGATAGVQAAREEFESRRIQQESTWKKRKLRNTKLLCSRYREFKIHASNAMYEAKLAEREEMMGDILDLMMNTQRESIAVDAIRATAMRTKMLVAHIDKMLVAFEALARADGDAAYKEYLVLRMAYFDEERLTLAQIAEQQYISESAVYKSRDRAIERFSSLLFGVDSTKFV